MAERDRIEILVDEALDAAVGAFQTGDASDLRVTRERIVEELWAMAHATAELRQKAEMFDALRTVEARVL